MVPISCDHGVHRLESLDNSSNGTTNIVAHHQRVQLLHPHDTNAMTGPTPLPPTPWHFPDPNTADPHGVVGIGADLAPATLVRAYQSGMFPMPAGEDGDGDETIAWWSPPHRGVLNFANLRITRSLRQSCRRYNVSVNQAFGRVIRACAELPRDGGWISPAVIDAYEQLHELGWAHSVETWHQGELVGGLYGVQIGGLFAGESMFHTATDASKVALVALVSGLEHCGAVLLDVQWATDHLATLGVCEITRGEYLERLDTAIPCQASSLAVLSGQNLLGKTPQFLDRILSKPTGSTPLPHRSTL